MSSKVINAQNAKAVDICSSKGIKKSYLSRIRSGTLLPPDFGIIVDIARSIDGSEEEYRSLVSAYYEAKSAAEMIVCWVLWVFASSPQLQI